MMTFFEWLVVLLTSGALGALGSNLQVYLVERWLWLATRDKVGKLLVQIAITTTMVTALYWLTVLFEVTPMPLGWRVAVNDIGTYALVALGVSQIRYQGARQAEINAAVACDERWQRPR